jgi:hypothetical protein
VLEFESKLTGWKPIVLAVKHYTREIKCQIFFGLLEGARTLTDRITICNAYRYTTSNIKLVLGAGIEPALGPHLGHTRYKLVGASNYTNPVF